MPEPTIVKIEPGDLVLIGNVGELSEKSHEEIGRIREKLPTALGVFFFEGDIDLTVLTGSGKISAPGCPTCTSTVSIPKFCES